MPPRHAYWTIIFGNQPTAFRTATREELLPTFRQIQSKHPDAVMMWFARGRLWKSEEEAREALLRRREERRPPRPPRFDRGPGTGERPPAKDRWRNRPQPGPRPGRDWRPGGDHKDPRDRFKVPRDVKRARFKANLRRDRFNPKPGPPKPGGDRPKGPGSRKPRKGNGGRDDEE